jgi:pullulanase
MNIDDFTRGFRRGRAPLAALIPGEISQESGTIPTLDYLAGLGVNAILFMPWTAWKNRDFDWGYVPFQYFAVEYRYVNDASKEKEITKPEEKISWLKKVISECHKRGIHVIMDGVFNHVSPDFPYKQFYRNQNNCPYTGEFGEVFGGLQDLNFNETCTQEFIRDVCLYWIDTFKIDGIRFDNTKGFYKIGNNGRPELKGIPTLLEDIQDYLDKHNEKNFFNVRTFRY